MMAKNENRCQKQKPASGCSTKTSGRRSGPLVIDLHTHLRVPEVTELIAKHLPPEHPEYQLAAGFAEKADKHQQGRGALASRLADMDACGIDMQVVSGQVSQYCYWAEGETGPEIARFCNDRLADFVALKPDRFIGMGTVPMQSVSEAVKELKRMTDHLGFRAVMISTQIEGVDLGDERFLSFWAQAEILGLPVFIHPAGLKDPRFKKHRMWSGLGQPIEEAVAMAFLIYEGILDRFPGLKLCIAHGGGFLPYYAGRVDRNYRNRPEATKNIDREPSEYLNRFFYDTVVYNSDILEFLVRKVGSKQVILGSDYPVGESNPVAFVKGAGTLSDIAKRRICGENAARLLGIAV